MTPNIIFDFPDPLTLNESPDPILIFPGPPAVKESSYVPASSSANGQESLSSHSSWSVVDDSEQSYEQLSEDDAASSLSDHSPMVVRSLVLTPSPALSDWGSDAVSLDTSSHSDGTSSSWGSQSVPSASEMQGIFRAKFKNVHGRGAALEWFLSQNFLDGTDKPPTGYLDSKSFDSSNPTPVRRVFPDLFIAGSSRDHRHDAYYHILLRRRKIHSAYRNREIEARGRKPDPDWRWCGFTNCQATACAYGEISEGQQVLVPRDLYSKRKVAISLLAGFEESFRGELYSHLLVAFATSPPIARALADCFLVFSSNNGDSEGPSSFEDDVQRGAVEFLALGSKIPDLSPCEETRFHKMVAPKARDPREGGCLDLVLAFMMHAEAWRSRQTDNGYPWAWHPQRSVEIFKMILHLHRDLINAGEVVLKDEPEGNGQEKMWRLWLEAYRPWNDCKVNFLSDLQADSLREDDRSGLSQQADPSVYEGVGLSPATWWPNQSRAPGLCGKSDTTGSTFHFVGR